MDKSPSLNRPSTATTGFSSPAEDFIENHLDLNQLCITHPAATFFARVAGDSMIDAGIFPKDILVVDRSLTPTSGKIVLAVMNGEFVVKRLKIKNNHYWLMTENQHAAQKSHPFNEGSYIWGVVTFIIRKTK